MRGYIGDNFPYSLYCCIPHIGPIYGYIGCKPGFGIKQYRLIGHFLSYTYIGYIGNIGCSATHGLEASQGKETAREDQGISGKWSSIIFQRWKTTSNF